jgi:hypothetical protein
VEQGHKPELEKIINGLECPNDFRCYEEHYENLCQARSSSVDELFVECSEKGRVVCNFLFGFGNSYYCHCPLAIYIARALQK